MNLFAGIGLNGEMRFIGEVERGAACGCRCPECNSPLIAKQGDEKEWHFAHEAGQERPECHAGAMNMLRRLAIEYLKLREVLLLPPYQVSVRASSPLGGRSETVEWRPQFQGPLKWLPKGTRYEPIAVGRLNSQIDANVFVEVGEPYPAKANQSAGMAGVDFVCSVPPLSDLRIRSRAEQHLRNFGRVQWRHHPDTLGLVAAAQKRVNAKAAEDAARVKEVVERQAREQQQRAQGHQVSDRSPTLASPAPAPKVEQHYPWAPLLNPSSAFIFYRLNDGSAWVVYTMTDDKVAIAPWPMNEGWDEALPPSVGAADPALGVYRGRSFEAVMIFFGQRATKTLATRNPNEFSAL